MEFLMLSKIVIPQAGDGHNQGLRTGLALSMLSGLPLEAKDLRDDNPRFRPGLGRGSLNLLAALARASQGAFTGIMGQDEAGFVPGRLLQGNHTLSLSALRFSEAPLAWMLETLVPALNNLEQPGHVLLSGGGTHVFGGPSSEEIQQLILPLWRRMGMEIEYMEIAPGFHPNAAGEAELSLTPCHELKPLQMTEPFRPLKVGASAVIAGLPIYLMEKALEAVESRLSRHGWQAELSLRHPDSGQGQAMLLWADNGQWRVGFSVIGRKGARLDTMAGEAVEQLLEFLDSATALPARQALWLLLPMCQARGRSCILFDKISSSLRAGLRALEQLRPGQAKILPQDRGAILQIFGAPFPRPGGEAKIRPGKDTAPNS
jgi:RNA 3'-terminal phosphate cyclase (ATP)